MTHPDKARSFAAIGGSVDVETAPADLPAGRSFLMDMYAESALRYMEQTGATRADFARVVVKNQRHGMLNPAAQYGGELTVEQVLAAREIVWPFTLQMCSPISDGAAAALLVSDELCPPAAAAVAVLASVATSAPADGTDERDRPGRRRRLRGSPGSAPPIWTASRSMTRPRQRSWSSTSSSAWPSRATARR